MLSEGGGGGGRHSKTTNITAILKAIELDKKNNKCTMPLRGLIPGDHVAFLIGPGGRNLTHLSKSCDALISLSQSKLRNRFRVFTVNGQPRNCANVWTTYLQTFNTLCGLILPEAYIMFAENEGTFKEIAAKSNADIRITKECLPESTERIVKISIQARNQLEYFYTAVKLLAQHAIQHLRIVMGLPDTVFYEKLDQNNDEYQLKRLSESDNTIVHNPIY